MLKARYPQLLSLFSILVLCLSSQIASAAESTSVIKGLEQQLTPGGIAILQLGRESDFKQAPVVTYKNYQVWTKLQNQQWYAIIGIPLKKRGDTSPYPTKQAYFVDGEKRIFEVTDKEYPSQYLTVKKKHSNPNTQHLKRIKKEGKKITAAFKAFESQSQYQPFIWPTHGNISSKFGLQRYFNKQPRKPHSGLDVAAETGTKIVAPSNGKVSLTGDYFFNGNSVFIDHGQGLVSMYCHMNDIQVKQGEQVSQGQTIGTVGRTGRVTGPHLHWTISLNNVRVDPMLFVDIKQLDSFGCTAQGTCNE